MRRTNGKTVVATAITIGALTACVALFVAGLAEAAPPPDDGLGMVGLAPGQTARINVVNTQPPPDDGMPCRVELMFHDIMGNLIGRSMIVDLMPKHGAFLELKYEDIPVEMRGDTGARFGIQPCVMPAGDRTPRKGCAPVPTVEVYIQDTLQTMVLFGLTPVLSLPPDPTMPAP